MISKFFDILFDFGDEAKEKYGKKSPEYLTVRKITDALQKVYDDGVRWNDSDLDRKPKSKAEAIAFGIKQIKVYEDMEDGDTCYEIDNKHFDSPTEVIEYILEDRAANYSAIKKLCFDTMQKTLKAEIQMRLDAEMSTRFGTMKDFFNGQINV